VSTASGEVDVVVAGAGAAGLAAARTLARRGLEGALLEAKERVGGRAWTDSRTFGVPVDWDCHWLHSADVNPFPRLAEVWGLEYKATPADSGSPGSPARPTSTRPRTART